MIIYSKKQTQRRFNRARSLMLKASCGTLYRNSTEYWRLRAFEAADTAVAFLLAERTTPDYFLEAAYYEAEQCAYCLRKAFSL